ncbi:hypothetical protein ABIF44_007535 [Bradyrhizobium japonicum]|nr:hypothetical protein [Bradyrhizobium japonicum]MCS3986178.1 hypothetical protein [Bradyrhizobium japonicum]MCS4019007.1 hypothetical protein [Bradyrhizobium japonicum]MCS4206115.1 hypothetical protein [Bradyrhizobium japonicum]MDH6176930.1 hypothetical protein [Bradyrhizobium japonicum]
MLAPVDGNPWRSMADDFRITENGDDALMLLFCPTSQIGSRGARFSVSVTHCDQTAFLLCMGLFSHILIPEGPAGPSECLTGALLHAAKGRP